jgi:hypothetical protein
LCRERTFSLSGRRVSQKPRFSGLIVRFSQVPYTCLSGKEHEINVLVISWTVPHDKEFQ